MNFVVEGQTADVFVNVKICRLGLCPELEVICVSFSVYAPNGGVFLPLNFHIMMASGVQKSLCFCRCLQEIKANMVEKIDPDIKIGQVMNQLLVACL